ncbi:gluconolactonase [Sphingobacterium sp. DN00404]|uniref:Gluconolactonase n=1 Tax=Sphingobacterium micropteri TaxID=2763501 RepID=A0ABR7YP28_9SPHI|nr:L-dopachrome tautomerase-related protein [Sphingobacterium micropteri]MBD1432981.1 gluconolactonase [Sphingobacterium micropteri]
MVKNLIFIYLCTMSFHVLSQETKDARLEIVASFGKSQPIGVSVSSNNRVFVSFPRREPYIMGLSEIINGEPKPYPDKSWNAKNGDPNSHFVNVQDIYVDTEDQLWILDSKPSSAGSVFGKDGSEESRQGQFKLVQIDLANDKVVQQYTFDDLDKAKSGLNDVRVDTDKKLAYLSDPGQAGIVVLDLNTAITRLVLADSPFTKADPNVVLSYDGQDMRDNNGNPFRSNVNGIALTKDNKYFYFKPINTTKLYRIETVYLEDVSLTAEELKSKVENLGETTITHGLVADVKGNIYLTSSLDYSIKRYTPEGKMETVIQDSRLIWPDSLGLGSDGYLYFSCAQMNRLPQWNEGEDKVSYPYEVYRVKVL